MSYTVLRIQRLSLVILCLVLVGLPASADEQAKFQLKVTAEASDAIYQVGETARFVVTVTHGQTKLTDGEVSYVVDDFITQYPPQNSFPKGKLSLAADATVTVTSDRPVFLRCRATFVTPDGKRLQATAGIGFSPLKIDPSLPAPDDFDQFWDAQKKQLAAIEPDAQLSPVAQSDANLECFDVQVACLGGAPVSGYFGRPANAKPKSLPAILWVHGAGVRSSSLHNAINGARRGMLSMDINAHGIPNGKPAEFYSELAANELKNYPKFGSDNRETSYFRGMYLRIVRAIDFLTAQPEWNGRVLAVVGHSQGGGQAIVAGGIDKRVTLIATGVPAICDHSGRVAGRVNGWPKLVPVNSNGESDSTILEASRYVDAMNFASRCKADAIMSVGFIDATCPPSSCYAAYNLLRGTKSIINEPLMGHAAPKHIHAAFAEKLREHASENE